MISADFAPNEDAVDAAAGVWMGLRFLDWRKGLYSGKVKARIKRIFPGHVPFFYFSARAALYKILQSLPELSEGDEVLVLGFTCEATVLPITACKLKPVYVEIDQETYSLDPASVRKLLSPRTRVMIIQHTYGITPRRDELLEIAKKNDLAVIEDLAHGYDRALFAHDSSDTFKLLSFGRSKSISSVFGGAILVPESKKYKKLVEKLNAVQRSLPYPGSFQIWQLLWYKSLSVIIKKTYNWLFIGKLLHAVIRAFRFIPNELSRKERSGAFDETMVKAYPNALAYLLYIQLKKSERVHERRARACYIYNDLFNVRNSRFAHLTRYPLQIKNRDAIVSALRRQQIYIGTWYKYPQSSPAQCPVTDDVCGHIINLPTNISESEARTVARAVLKLQSS